MIKFATKIQVTDYFDQVSEGIRLNNETVSNLEGNDTENVVIKKVTVSRSEANTFSLSVVDLVNELTNVDTVSMSCFVPQQFKDFYAEPIPIKILWGSLYMGSMSTFTMYGVAEGLQNDLTFTEPIFPDEKDSAEQYIVNQIQVVLFIDLKEV